MPARGWPVESPLIAVAETCVRQVRWHRDDIAAFARPTGDSNLRP